LTDEDLFDLVEVIAFFNLINRIADAFGVPFEPEWSGEAG
jgi:alkylhydroperoxidase family enzyme